MKAGSPLKARMQAIDSVELQINGQWVKLLASEFVINPDGLSFGVDEDQVAHLGLVKLARDTGAIHQGRFNGKRVTGVYLDIRGVPRMTERQTVVHRVELTVAN